MKRFVICIPFLVYCSTNANAQAFSEGNNYVSVGYGFGTFAHAIISSFTDKLGFDYSTTGPIYLKYEHAMGNTLGLGVNVAYAQYKISYVEDASSGSAAGAYSLVHSSFSVLLRMNFHMGSGEKVDPYFGLGAGYRSGSWKVTSTAANYESPSIPDLIPFGFETTFGMRYFFAQNFAAYGELGLAKSFFQVGLTAKF